MSKVTERTMRVQIALPQRSVERLERLVQITEASSLAEVTRNALKLYETVITGAERGEPFFQRIDGEMVPVVMLIAPAD